jgi:hypothetical protein
MAPVWVFPRIRPFIMGGVDRTVYARQIMLFGLFQPHPDDAGFADSLAIRLTAKQLPEPDDLNIPPLWTETEKNAVIHSAKMGDRYHRFTDLEGEEDYLSAQLQAIVRPRWLRAVESELAGSAPLICLNVRRARDFRIANNQSEYFTAGAIRTPLEWFCDTLQTLRNSAGKDLPAILISDGTPEDLAPLLKCGNVRLPAERSAISDLLILSRTRFLIGSGGSSFSAWASFLGRMQTIVHPGQCLSWFGLRPKPEDLTSVFDPKAPNQDELAAYIADL